MRADTRTELFETTPVPRALMRMAIPTIISQLINLVYNMADTWFIGRAPAGAETETRPANAQKDY